MAFALVHFTVGFVLVLTVVSVVAATSYRLTAAYGGGVWALGPDIHHLVDGSLGVQIRAVHDGALAELFFFHSTLDTAFYRAHSMELTFVSLVVLGMGFLVYDWRFGVSRRSRQQFESADASDDLSD